MSSKYGGYSQKRGISREERDRIHPIWRGVGFGLMILIPLMSYAATEVFLNLNGKNNWFPIPVDLIAKRGDFLYRIFPDPMVNIKVMLFFVFLILFFAIFTWVSFLISGLFGYSNRRDPYYVPPVRRQRRRRY